MPHARLVTSYPQVFPVSPLGGHPTTSSFISPTDSHFASSSHQTIYPEVAIPFSNEASYCIQKNADVEDIIDGVEAPTRLERMVATRFKELE